MIVVLPLARRIRARTCLVSRGAIEKFKVSWFADSSMIFDNMPRYALAGARDGTLFDKCTESSTEAVAN